MAKTVNTEFKNFDVLTMSSRLFIVSTFRC
jgi:hypothetical protein